MLKEAKLLEERDEATKTAKSKKAKTYLFGGDKKTKKNDNNKYMEKSKKKKKKI